MVISNPRSPTSSCSPISRMRLLNLYGRYVRHDQLDDLGPDRPARLVPGPGLDRHEGPGGADPAGVPRCRDQGPPGRASDHPGRTGSRLEDDGGHPPARHDDVHEQPRVSRRQPAVAAAAAVWAWAAAWAAGGGRRRGGGGWAAADGWRHGRWDGRRWSGRRRWRAARAWPACVIINRVTVPGPRQVLLHVKIAEINRNATRSIGVSWLYARGKSIFGSAAGTNATMSTTTTATNTQITGPRGFAGPVGRNVQRDRHGDAGRNAPLFGVFDAGHFSLFIDALRTNTLAKILAEPNLVALDGQPARFLVGGLFPFPVPQSSSIPGGTAVVTVQFQRFGTILTFLPEILPNDVIRLDVEPVISQLNFAQRHDGQRRTQSPRSRSEARERSSSCGRARRWRSPDCSRRSPTPRTIRDPGAGRPADRGALVQRQQDSRRSRPRRSCWSLPSWSPPSTRRR